MCAAATHAQDAGNDDLIFIHHSCGNNWLKRGLHQALLEKPYVNQRNDICYGSDLKPDAGRPDSLRFDGKVPGDRTDMNHWICWFNDYLGAVKKHQTKGDRVNRIIMFKSCFPLSHVSADGSPPGDPFNPEHTLANYQALYRHVDGPAATYQRNGVTYKPLEQIFAENPDTLFIAVTSPPLHYAPKEVTTDDAAARARKFNNWLKNDWLAAYNAANPGLNNVAVFDWFDILANPDDHQQHPNRLRAEYGGEAGDAHPTENADQDSVVIFASGEDNYLDKVYQTFFASQPATTAP